AKGLLVFDSFWSVRAARKLKEAISQNLGRDDVTYVINMVDRLDMFGGNAAYEEAVIVGHVGLLEKYQHKQSVVDAELADLIEMWRWKEGVSRERLPSHEPGSEEERREKEWLQTCKMRADDLEFDYSLVLPTVFYTDRMTLNLGDLTLKLIWFGKEGLRDGVTLAVIPERKLAVVTSFILNPNHLAPYPHGIYSELDVPRWIAVLEEILEGEGAVEQVVCSDVNAILSRERAHSHLVYIRKLWDSVKAMEADGKDLPEIQDQLSIEKAFGFVKDMEVYKKNGDEWLRPQHRDHVKLFFMQHKDLLASEILSDGGVDGCDTSLARIRQYRKEGRDIFVDEVALNYIGYSWMRQERIAEAIEIFKLNVEVFPRSSNAYDSLGEACMKRGDKQNAIRNYNKSLELDPENSNAREVLKKLEL
ncbi:MAG: tetratricopeptide repeat protein, partial [Bacteroidota bacterium]